MSQEPLVLYVDDERGNRVVFEQSFGARFRVKTASGGPEALELLAKEEVAVLLTDQRMPEMSGDDLLRAVKERYPEIVRVVITAYADVEPILAAINEGLVARYVIKPWDRKEMEQLLRWAIEAWTLGRDSAALQRRLLENERLATLGSIVGAVIHDLNQPLIGLVMNGDRLVELADVVPLLRRVLGGEAIGAQQRSQLNTLLDELPEVADELRQSIDHMRNMTSGLGQWLKQSPATAVPPTADPVPVIRHAIGVCQDIAVRARGSLLYDGPAELPRVRIGATDLTQVMINLVANAAHALVARDKSGGRVTVFARAEDQLVRFEIRDEGVGMAPDVLAKVGTPFFTTRAEGTGLGVAQCHRLVGKAGGTFRIDSQVGVGTIVSFTLPKA
ncbi:MAG TPA: hybrid sensor histidine kinase/response regulator [Kofleriaceae bacterium]|jgi:two-component system response regulator PhcR|nr:hybrid sensor histidine kinase/response regulator [Kofleriaceae bacterium]